MLGVIEMLERLGAGAGVRHRLGAGEMLFAEISSTVIASEPAALDHEELRDDPEAAVILVGHLAQQVQALRGRIELLNIKSARDRVLGYLHSRLGASATAVELDRTWKAIASEIGLTHEAVYRALAELEQNGLIERDGNAVTLRER
jgi:CRP-like cAMP-binding protein